jgi:hypothetical protein
MTVIEYQFDCIHAYRFYGLDVDMLLVQLQDLLPGAVAAYCGRGRIYSKKFAGQAKIDAIIKRHIQDSRLAVQLDLGG